MSPEEHDQFLEVIVVIVAAVFAAAAFGIVRLMYGREGLAFRKEKGKKNIAMYIVFAFVLFLWIVIFFIIISVDAKYHTWAPGNIVVIILAALFAPLFFGVHILIARIRIKKQMEEERDARRREALSRNETIWICPRCGKENFSSTKICECGAEMPRVKNKTVKIWTCPVCGKENQDYVGTCACGQKHSPKSGAEVR